MVLQKTVIAVCITAFLTQTGVHLNAAAIDCSSVTCSSVQTSLSLLPQAVSNIVTSTLISSSVVVTVPCA